MKLAALAAMLAGGCFIATPPMRFGGKSSQEAQRQTLGNETPPALVSNATWSSEVSTQRIRVYADDDFRAQNVHWQHTFDDELAYANEVLAPLLGIRLVAEYRSWQHHAPGGSLADSLEELARLDPGSDVLSVVGLTSALALVSGTFDQLGYASIQGRHLIVRGYADREERQMFERAFPDLRADERDALFASRRRHKTAAVLLHELGHNLGATHETEANTIMNATYSDHSASFSDHSREVMLATLAERVHRGHGTATVNHPHPQLVVRINDKQQAVIGGQLVDDATVAELFRMSYADDHDTQVVIKAPRSVPSAAVVRLLELAKAAGLQRSSREIDDGP